MREKLKLYYRCRFTQLSPLRLSGGKNDRTDNDLMLDSRGLPMIPGSALAGVLRGRLTREEANLLFGRDTVGDAMTESAVLVGDAALPGRREGAVHPPRRRRAGQAQGRRQGRKIRL